MKKITLLTALAALAVAATALAGSVTTSYQLDAVNSAPTSATAGIPLGGVDTVSHKYLPIKTVVVTVTAHYDGGVGTEFPVAGSLLFWRYTPLSTTIDGGTNWGHFAALDKTIASTATGVSQTFSVDVAGTAAGDIITRPGLGDQTNQLYVSTSGVALVADGGSPVTHVITLEGRF